MGQLICVDRDDCRAEVHRTSCTSTLRFESAPDRVWTLTGPQRVDQTILSGDPKRIGNCFAACVASFLGVTLEVVPNFVEHGDRGEDGYALGWWWMAIGFMAAHGLWPIDLENVDQADPGEVVFVAGPSARGVAHQVLYLDGELWHDPHPSRAGLLEVTEVLAWRPQLHDHAPTPICPVVVATGRCTLAHGHLKNSNGLDHVYPSTPIPDGSP